VGRYEHVGHGPKSRRGDDKLSINFQSRARAAPGPGNVRFPPKRTLRSRYCALMRRSKLHNQYLARP
jgi:hypothetical protein